jgi:hypothetical protein
MRTSFHHQPEAQHPKIFSYPQAGLADYPILWGVRTVLSGIRTTCCDIALFGRAKEALLRTILVLECV